MPSLTQEYTNAHANRQRRMDTLWYTSKLIKQESDSRRRGARTTALNIDVMKGRGSTDAEEKMERDRESEGGMEGSKGGSESIPCWTVWKLVAVSRHKKEQNKCGAVHTLLSVHAERADTSLPQMKIQNICNQHSLPTRESPLFLS